MRGAVGGRGEEGGGYTQGQVTHSDSVHFCSRTDVHQAGLMPGLRCIDRQSVIIKRSQPSFPTKHCLRQNTEEDKEGEEDNGEDRTLY